MTGTTTTGTSPAATGTTTTGTSPAAAAPAITGTTRIVQIIGHPVRQVRSPDLLNALLARRGADAVLVPVDILPEDLPRFVALQRAWRNSAGFIVTVPHKRAAAGLVDALSPRAARLSAVNLVVRGGDGALSGDHLDGMGFMAAARAQGFDPEGRAALVVGAGGVGGAIADALRAAFPAVELAGDAPGCDGGGSLAGFDLVVNATPAGMNGAGGLPLAEAEIATLRPGAHVADVVTVPAMTPFLEAARARGCRVQTGPEMTAAQMEEFATRLGLLA